VIAASAVNPRDCARQLRKQSIMNHLSQILLGASRHASTDATRPHLSSVRLSWSLGAWIAMATDGHTLFVASAKGDGEPFEALYDAKAVAKGAKLAKGRHGYATREADGTLMFDDGAGSILRVEPRTSSLRFPQVEQVIPRTLVAGEPASFSAKYLAAHAETHAMLASDRTCETTLTLASALDPAMLVTQHAEFRVLSVIMPMRGRASEAGDVIAWVRARSGAPVAAAATTESEAAE
jgi:hypothetical protein